MIQRIQTLLLLASTFILAVLFFIPLAEFQSAQASAALVSGGILAWNSGEELIAWPLLIGMIVMVAMPVVTIFFYKKRMLQIRLAIFSAVLELLFIGLIWFMASELAANLKFVTYTVSWYLILPLLVIAAVFNLAAIKFIGQDEMLIRSLNSNRIR